MAKIKIGGQELTEKDIGIYNDAKNQYSIIFSKADPTQFKVTSRDTSANFAADATDDDLRSFKSALGIDSGGFDKIIGAERNIVQAASIDTPDQKYQQLLDSGISEAAAKTLLGGYTPTARPAEGTNPILKAQPFKDAEIIEDPKSSSSTKAPYKEVRVNGETRKLYPGERIVEVNGQEYKVSANASSVMVNGKRVDISGGKVIDENSGGGFGNANELSAQKKSELSSQLGGLNQSLQNISSSDPSIINYLNNAGQPSSFASRQKLAQSFGIQGYSGTAAQNTQLLSLLKAKDKARIADEIQDIQGQIAQIDQDANDNQKKNAENIGKNLDADVDTSQSSKIVKDIEDSFGESPDVPDLAETFEKQRELYGVEDLEVELNDLDAQIEQLDADFISLQEHQESRSVAQGSINKNLSRDQVLYNRQRRDMVAERNSVANMLNTKYSVISTLMNFTQQDYTNASAKYTADFNKAVAAYQLVEDAENREEISARANLQVIHESIREGSIDYNSLNSSQKSLITRLEAQAGLPMGFSDLVQQSPDKIISSSTRSSGGQKFTDIIRQSSDGQIYTQTVGHGSVDGGDANTPTFKFGNPDKTKLLGVGFSTQDISDVESGISQGYTVDEIIGFSPKLSSNQKEVLKEAFGVEKKITKEQIATQVTLKVAQDGLKNTYTTDELFDLAKDKGHASFWTGSEKDIDRFLNSEDAKKLYIDILYDQYKVAGMAE